MHGTYNTQTTACTGIRSTGVSPPPPDIRIRLEREAAARASAFWDKKNWLSAINAYREALGYCRARNANCQYILDNIDGAMKNNAYANRDNAARRGGVFFDQENWQAAISAYQEARSYCLAKMDCQYLLDNIAAAVANAANAENTLGNSYFERGNWTWALRSYEKARNLCKRDCAYIDRNIVLAKNRQLEIQAKLYMDNDQWQTAINYYAQALRNCRTDMDCQYLRDNIKRARKNAANAQGDSYLNGDQRFLALASFQEALKHCQISCGYLHRKIAGIKNHQMEDMAKVYIDSGQWQAAINQYEKILDGCRPDMNCDYASKKIAGIRQDWNKQVRELRAEDRSKAFDMANEHRDHGDYSAELNALTRALSSCPRGYKCEGSINRRIKVAERRLASKSGDDSFQKGNWANASNAYSQALKDCGPADSDCDAIREKKALSNNSSWADDYINRADHLQAPNLKRPSGQILLAAHAGVKAIEQGNVEQWMIEVERTPENILQNPTAMEKMRCLGGLAFDGGRQCGVNIGELGQIINEINAVPGFSSGPVGAEIELPEFDLESIPLELRATSQWRELQVRAENLGLDYQIAKVRLKVLEEEQSKIEINGGERIKNEIELGHAETDLRNIGEAVAEVIDDIGSFVVNFDITPEQPDSNNMSGEDQIEGRAADNAKTGDTR